MDINVEFGQMFDGDVVEWFEAEGHVFDLCGINQSDRIALEKLKELYDASSPAKKQ
jgi:hypothetical protein